MDPYPGLRIARIDFDPPIKCDDCDNIVLAFMRLLIKYAYTIKCDYGKLTLSYVMNTTTKKSDVPLGPAIPFTLGPAITFRENGKASQRSGMKKLLLSTQSCH